MSRFQFPKEEKSVFGFLGLTKKKKEKPQKTNNNKTPLKTVEKRAKYPDAEPSPSLLSN